MRILYFVPYQSDVELGPGPLEQTLVDQYHGPSNPFPVDDYGCPKADKDWMKLVMWRRYPVHCGCGCVIDGAVTCGGSGE